MTAAEVTYSDRGFAQFGKAFRTDYGHEIRVYQSSSAEKDAVWMSVDLSPENSDGLFPVDTAVHMDLDQAKALRDRLSAWINMIEGFNDSDVDELRGELAKRDALLSSIADSLSPWRTE